MKAHPWRSYLGIAVARPTCDRLLCVQDVVVYVLNGLSAFYAFAAYHVVSYDEVASLTTSDALMEASV